MITPATAAPGEISLQKKGTPTGAKIFESATFTGDQRALTDEDLRLLENRFERYPTREEVGQKLIRDCYGDLIRRIEQGVNFDPW